MTNETFAALLPMCDEIHPMFSLFFHCLGQEFYKLNVIIINGIIFLENLVSLTF